MRNLGTVSGMLVLLVLLAGVFVYHRIQQGKTELSYQPVDQRRIVEGLRLETADGNTTTLDQFRGKVVLIDVWASWCGPCLQAVPKLIALQDEFGPDLVVVGLNVDQEGWDAVAGFLKAFPDINYLIVRPVPEPLIVNTIVDLRPLGQVSALPTAFLLDHRGGLVSKYVGGLQANLIPEDIERLLEEKSLAQAESLSTNQSK